MSNRNRNTWTLREAVQHVRNQAPSFTSTATTSTSSTAEVSTSDNSKSSRNSIKSVLSSKVVTCLVAFGVGVRVGIKSAGQTSATTVTGRARQFPLVSLILVVTIVREVYRVIPAWAKKKRKQKTTALEEDSDDMSSLATISLKLQSLFKKASEKLTSTMPSANVRASLLAVVQLMAQAKEQQAQERDEAYNQAGVILENPKELMQYFAQYFEYADWAYDEYSEEDTEQSLQERLATCQYELLRHDQTTLPGRVAHYVAVSPEERIMLIGIKGTSGFEDMLTDCCGLAKPFTLSAPFVSNGSTEIFAHEGIYISSRTLASDLEPLIKYVAIPNGYDIVLTGHSLGAGAAAMVGLLLRSKFAELQQDSRLKVLAFASPPILDRESALASTSFITTIVNNADVIPRASLHNLAILMEFMKIVNGKLEEEGKSPDSIRNVAAFMKYISEGKDGKMLMSPDEIKNAINECVDKLSTSDPDFLYVPGQIIHMYDLWAKKNYKQAEQQVEKETEEVEDDDEVEELTVKTAERVYEGDGASQVLKIIEVDERMVLDHLSEGYRGSIRSLLES